MADEPSRKPKSILKKPRFSELSFSEPRLPQPRRPRSQDPEKLREIAIQHATIIQHRKELEAVVLDSIVALSEFPLVRTATQTAERPAKSDVALFKSYVRLFQPSDYDDLIIERKSNGLCGYALCPKPSPRLGSGGRWKLVNVGRSDFDIQSREELEKWCSQDCKRRALWIRIQLEETTAWERENNADIIINLLGEDIIMPVDETADALARLQLDEKKKAEAANSALALERGNDPDSVGLVEVSIHEKVARAPDAFEDATQRSDDDDDDDQTIEGYRISGRRIL